ncbi:MAG: DUF4810 domain-containing protein [Sulfurimonas sp.]|nr:DUF4810 domain-containing protein [Sulfurimonas sp.]
MISSRYIKLLSAVAISFFIVGCGGPKPLYVYGDYSDSYYAYKKDMSPESMLELQKVIEEAIEEVGDSRSGRVAPGMYANLGYIYLKSGKAKEAVESFNKEKSIYPESAHFMNRIIKKVELAQGDEK